MIKKLAVMAISSLCLSHVSLASNVYCGRVLCAAALDGCQVIDGTGHGKKNPVVLVNDESGTRYNFVSRKIADKISSLDSRCACVLGSVVKSKTPGGSPFYYFSSVSSVNGIAEHRCLEEGL